MTNAPGQSFHLDPRPALMAHAKTYKEMGMLARFCDKTRFEPETGCLVWTAAMDRDGFGAFRVGDRSVTANSASYRLFCGPIGPGEIVRQTCGDHACVHPDHLEKGHRVGRSKAIAPLPDTQQEPVKPNAAPVASLKPLPAAPLLVYTDGACSGNGTTSALGGWAVVFSDGRTPLSGSCWVPGVTNIRMEITAAMEALKATATGSVVTVFSDLQLITGVMKDGWKAKANLDLWTDLKALAAERNVTWEWVRGHDGHPENEKADKLAQDAAKGFR